MYTDPCRRGPLQKAAATDGTDPACKNGAGWISARELSCTFGMTSPMRGFLTLIKLWNDVKAWSHPGVIFYLICHPLIFHLEVLNIFCTLCEIMLFSPLSDETTTLKELFLDLSILDPMSHCSYSFSIKFQNCPNKLTWPKNRIIATGIPANLHLQIHSTYSTQLMCTRFGHVYIFNPQFIHMQWIENMWINDNFKSCFGSPCIGIFWVVLELPSAVCSSSNARCSMLTQALDHPVTLLFHKYTQYYPCNNTI